MDDLLNTIKRFGYRTNEAKIYLAALSLPESSISEIAKKARLPLSSAQVAIEKLHKDSLVNFYIRKHHKFWKAEKPSRFINLLKEKEENLSCALEKIKSQRENTDPENKKPSVEVFVGKNEIKAIHDKIIEKKHHIRAITPFSAWTDLLGENYVNDFLESCAKHFLEIRLLTCKDCIDKFNNKSLCKAKALPESIKIEDIVFIFNNSIAIITLNKNQPTGIIIEDPATSQMMDIFFENWWE